MRDPSYAAGGKGSEVTLVFEAGAEGQGRTGGWAGETEVRFESVSREIRFSLWFTH